MKKIVWICFMFLSPFSTNVWANDKDPYYFLNPKILAEHPIEIPFENIDKKGGEVSTYFWKVPQPKPTWFGFIPVGSWNNRIMIKIRGAKKHQTTYSMSDYFEEHNPNKEPMFLVEIFKINDDLTKESVFKKTLTSLSRNYGLGDGDEHWQMMYGIEQINNYEFGQYQIIVKSLLETPELKDNNQLEFFLYLTTDYQK